MRFPSMRGRTRVLLVVLMVSMMMVGPGAVPAQAAAFTDIASSGFETEIVWLAFEGITLGCNQSQTLFCPDQPVTRGQMAAFLARALNLPSSTTANPFIDDNGSIFEVDITKILAAGITQGCNQAQTLFCPDQPVTRGQMAAFLARALNLPSPTTTNPFSDDNGSIFEIDITKILAAGITQGCNQAQTLFCPDQPVTRGQMAAFLYRPLGPDSTLPTGSLGSPVDPGTGKPTTGGDPAGSQSTTGAVPTTGTFNGDGGAAMIQFDTAPVTPGEVISEEMPIFSPGVMSSPKPGVDYLTFIAGQPIIPATSMGWLDYQSLPYAVGQLLGLQSGTTSTFWTCSGTLVDRDLVLTAAHCLYNKDTGVAHAGWWFTPDEYGDAIGVKPAWWGTQYYVIGDFLPWFQSNLQSAWVLDYALIRVQPDQLGRLPGDVYQPMQVYMLGSAETSLSPGMYDWDVARTSIGYPTEGWYSTWNGAGVAWPWVCQSTEGIYYHYGNGFYSIGMGCKMSGGHSGGPILQVLDGKQYVVSVNSTMGFVYPCSSYVTTCSDRYFGDNAWGPALLNTAGGYGFDELWNAAHP